MFWVLGIILVVAIWAMLIAWIAKVSRAHAYSAAWALVAGLLGAVGFAAGVALLATILDRSDETIGLALFAILAPLVLMIAMMVAVAMLLKRGAIGGVRRAKWQVHILERGSGWLRIEEGRVVFEWLEGSREVALAQLQRVHADGECVRVQCEDEIVVMPLDDSLGPQGRRRICGQIAQRLQASLPVAVLRR